MNLLKRVPCIYKTLNIAGSVIIIIVGYLWTDMVRGSNSHYQLNPFISSAHLQALFPLPALFLGDSHGQSHEIS